MSLALWFWTLLTGSRLKALLYEGERRLGRERFTEALELFRRAAQEQPRSPEGFLGLSRTYLAMGLTRESQQEAALGQALKRLASHPDDAACRLQLAQGFMDRSMPNLALEHVEAALKQSPNDLAILTLAAAVFRANHDPKRALAALKQVLQHSPLDPKLYQQKAACQRALGDQLEAAKSAALAAALAKQAEDPADLEALQTAVFQLNANNLRHLALQLVESSLAASPEKAYLHCLRGEALLDRGEAQGALKSLEQAVGLDPLSQRAQLLLSKAYAQQKDQAKADLHRDLAGKLEAAKGLDDAVEAESMLVQVLMESGQGQAAKDRASALAAAHPKDWRGVFALGSVLERQGNHVEALACMGRAAKLAPRNPRPLLARAAMYSRLGDAVEAISQARQAVAAAPRDADVRRALARILRAHGQARPAQEEEELAEAMSRRSRGGDD
jgi:tetratricopeptide (TPR) repeat protein